MTLKQSDNHALTVCLTMITNPSSTASYISGISIVGEDELDIRTTCILEHYHPGPDRKMRRWTRFPSLAASIPPLFFDVRCQLIPYTYLPGDLLTNGTD